MSYIEIISKLCKRCKQAWVQSPDQEDLLEERMATHSSILAWRIPWTEEPGRLQSIGCKESDTTAATELTHNPYINAFASIQGMMLKLKLQYFGHLM